MEMTKGSQGHGLILTPNINTPPNPIALLHIQIIHCIVIIILTRTFYFNIRGFDFFLLLLLLLFEGAVTKIPVVVSVLDLEILHEGPVVVSVAFRELLEFAGTTAEDFLAREVGGA